MNNTAYERIAKIAETYSSALLTFMNYRNGLKELIPTVDNPEKRERLEKELYNVREKVKTVAEGRAYFLRALMDEAQKARPQTPEPEQLEVPTLEAALVA